MSPNGERHRKLGELMNSLSKCLAAERGEVPLLKKFDYFFPLLTLGLIEK